MAWRSCLVQLLGAVICIKQLSASSSYLHQAAQSLREQLEIMRHPLANVNILLPVACDEARRGAATGPRRLQ
jgi:hypothetical protein